MTGWLARVLSRVPLSVLAAASRVLAWAWWTVIPVRKKTAIDNLAHAFPALEAGTTLRQSMGDILLGYGELLHLDRAGLPGLRFEGHEGLMERVSSGEGALLLAGHGGSWDLALTGAAKVLGMPLSIMVFPPAHAGAAEVVEGLRSRAGVDLIHPRGGIKALMAQVRAGRVGVVTLDQRQNAGVPIQFFGRPAWTSRGIGILTRRLKVPVYTVWQWREGTGRHVVRFDGPLELPEDADDATRHCLWWYEQRIREHPHGWLWLHDRWKRVG